MREGAPSSRAASSRQADDAPPPFAYEDEDQSHGGLRLGLRVRHAQFGVGTILGMEGDGEDLKLMVRFTSVGTKRLLAKYAKLERA